MKPYFGLRGSSLNIMISIIAGLDFLYVMLLDLDVARLTGS